MAEVFVRAVMECPLPGSAEYEERVSALRLKPAEPPQQLIVLEGLEPVRLRPGMYIGSTDARGLTALLFEVVANALDLNLAGRASRIEISIAPDDTVTVEDDGDGFPLEATVGGTPAFTAIFERLHATPTLDGHPTHVHVRPGLAGCGISVVQVLSERFEVETVRDGLLHHAVFEKGKLTSPLTCAGATTRRGTRIRYRADQTIIEAHHDLAAIETLLRPLGALLPKLDLRWQGQSLRRPGGLADWVKERAPRAIAESLLSVEGELHDVGVEVSFAWEPTRTTPWLLTFVNCAETTEAGTHAVGLFEAFARTAPTPALAKQARDGLVAVVHVWMLHPRFRGPTRAALEVETARFAVRDVVSDALRKAPWWDRLSEQLGR